MKRKLVIVPDTTGHLQLFQVAEKLATVEDLGKVSPHMARRIARGEKIKRVSITRLPLAPNKPDK